MLTIDFQSRQAFLQTNWGWASTLAGSKLALTALAASLLKPARTAVIAVWLKGGAHTEKTRSRTFVSPFRLFGAACRHGNSLGCTILGDMHQRGLSASSDPAEAARLHRQACDGGDAFGCASLAMNLEVGLGIESGPVEAARLWQAARALGWDAADCARREAGSARLTSAPAALRVPRRPR
jgi:hypothetical protein